MPWDDVGEDVGEDVGDAVGAGVGSDVGVPAVTGACVGFGVGDIVGTPGQSLVYTTEDDATKVPQHTSYSKHPPGVKENALQVALQAIAQSSTVVAGQSTRDVLPQAVFGCETYGGNAVMAVGAGVGAGAGHGLPTLTTVGPTRQRSPSASAMGPRMDWQKAVPQNAGTVL